MRSSLVASLTLLALASSGCDSGPIVDFFQQVTRDPGFPGGVAIPVIPRLRFHNQRVKSTTTDETAEAQLRSTLFGLHCYAGYWF